MKVHVMIPFRCIYVNCFNRFRFLAEISTTLLKMHFFQQVKDQNSEREHGNYTNEPLFHLLFLLLPSVAFISEFENTQNLFSCGPFSRFWSVKYINFWPKATNSAFSGY